MDEYEADAAAGPTGDAQVDEALRPLRRLDGLPVHEHAALVEQVHHALQERLAVGDESGGAGGEG